jgi:hypothetical protein
MNRLAASLAATPGYESRSLLTQSLTEAYYGRLVRSRALSNRAAAIELAHGAKDTAGGIEATAALIEDLFGNSALARTQAAEALKLLGDTPLASIRASSILHPFLAVALAGDPDQASKLAERVIKNSAPGNTVFRVWGPEVEAMIEIRRAKPERALELLTPVVAWESGWGDTYMSAWLRGQAYLSLGRGAEAAEFGKILAHRGAVSNSPIGPLARLGLARAARIQGDNVKARVAYRDFLALWKGADAEIPVLAAARSEYDRLRPTATM